MKNNFSKMLKVLEVLSWIFFIGMCVEAGSFIFNMIYAAGFQPLAADYFLLTDLLRFSKFHFVAIMSVAMIAAILKALALYCIVKIFTDKKLNMQTPFNEEFAKFIFTLSKLTFAIGLVSLVGAKFTNWIAEQNVMMPSLDILRLAGADVWIFMGATLYVIGLIFRRGVEMQRENELTI